MLDFCYLVNPYFPPQKLLDEIKANFEILATQYPSALRINCLLAAKFFEIAQSRIVTGNGAAELIKSVLEQITGKIGVVFPSFEEYSNRKTGDVIAFKPDNETLSYSAQDLTNFFSGKSVEALVVINPDNPTGNYVPYEDMLKLIEWTKEKNIKLILDESFIDFADIKSTLLIDDLLIKYPHLIVIKSISKAYGIPGFRLGILACGDELLINTLRKDLPIWNINSFAEFYLQICEKYKKDFTNAMERFYPVRDEFYTALKNIPFLKPIPSKANYFTCRLTVGTAAELTEFLLNRHNILIKDLSGKNNIVGEYVRVAVKTPEENAKLLEALKCF